MTDLFDKMLGRYDIRTAADRQNALFEITQQVALAGLQRGDFFSKAAFYGGTCLRIFHGLPRFSEDMDFSLLAPDETFRFENYFQPIIDEFAALGRRVEITRKDKTAFGKVESAFLKDNTDVYDITFRTEKSIKVKIEVDTLPPPGFRTELRWLLQPYSFGVRCYTIPHLYAGKMHALVFRSWKNRIKGRDWFDFEWYVRQGSPLDYGHLRERIRQFNGLDIGFSEFKTLLTERISAADIEQVKADVRPFLKDDGPLDVWTNDYFLMLADMINVRLQ